MHLLKRISNKLISVLISFGSNRVTCTNSQSAMPISLDDRTEVSSPEVRIRQLTALGSAVEVDPTIPPKRYFRSGIEMVRIANVYEQEHQWENAFILFHKFITLFVEKLPKHPEYKNVSAEEKAANKQKLKEVFPLAEELKLKLKSKYSSEYETWLVKKKKRDEEEAQEKQRRLIEEAKKKEFELEKQWRLAQERQKHFLPQGTRNGELFQDPSHRVVSKASPEVSDIICYNVEDADKEEFEDFPSTHESGLNVPTIDRKTKPRSLLSPGPSEDQTSAGLRKMLIPKRLIESFLRLAQANTTRNVETCGILAGKMAQNQFTISHLLVPKQTGTPDSCTTDNEEELFSYQDQHDLITLGWIHTHPSQTAFMSSVDLHTHCSYQLMMPEAIAIVCSPKYNETGIFSLNDFGVDYIANCRQIGFHPHPNEPPLYEESSHSILKEDAQVVVVDLRP